MTTTNSRWLAATLWLVLCTRGALPGATFVVTTNGDFGSNTLGQAILDANTNQNLDTIEFNIPGSCARRSSNGPGRR